MVYYDQVICSNAEVIGSGNKDGTYWMMDSVEETYDICILNAESQLALIYICISPKFNHLLLSHYSGHITVS